MKYVLLILLLALCGACTQTHEPETTPPIRLRVLTYNIHHGRGADGEINLQRIADIINRARPDLVALQEVDVNTRRSGGVDQAAVLGELTGMYVHFGRAIDFQGGEYGNAVLSREPFEDTMTWDLSGEGERRCLAAIRFNTTTRPSFEIVFGSTHLSHTNAPDRRSALFTIRQDTFAYNSKLLPCILAGDFNLTPDSDEYRFATGQLDFVDAAAQRPHPQATCPAEDPTIRIDYVFYRPAPNLRTIEALVLDEPTASDHRPLLVVLEYVPPALPFAQ